MTSLLSIKYKTNVSKGTFVWKPKYSSNSHSYNGTKIIFLDVIKIPPSYYKERIGDFLRQTTDKYNIMQMAIKRFAEYKKIKEETYELDVSQQKNIIQYNIKQILDILFKQYNVFFIKDSVYSILYFTWDGKITKYKQHDDLNLYEVTVFLKLVQSAPQNIDEKTKKKYECSIAKDKFNFGVSNFNSWKSEIEEKEPEIVEAEEINEVEVESETFIGPLTKSDYYV